MNFPKVTKLPGSSEADVEGGASESNKTILSKCVSSVPLHDIVTYEVIIITANNLVVALGSANTNNADGAAGHAAVEML